MKIAAGIVLFEGSAADGDAVDFDFGAGRVPVIGSFSACVALVKKAKEINTIEACSRRERSIGEHLYCMEMNPDRFYHKVVYRCGKSVVGSSLSEAHLPVKRVARFRG